MSRPLFSCLFLATALTSFSAHAQRAANALFGEAPAMREHEILDTEILTDIVTASPGCENVIDPVKQYERGVSFRERDDKYSKIAASDCFIAAATQNYSPAQLVLAKMYYAGEGVPEEPSYAYKWAQMAVILGNGEALAFRDQLETKISLQSLELALQLLRPEIERLDSEREIEQRQTELYEASVDKKLQESFGIDTHDTVFITEAPPEEQGPSEDELLLKSFYKSLDSQKRLAAMRDKTEEGDASGTAKGRRRRTSSVSMPSSAMKILGARLDSLEEKTEE